MMYPQHRWFRKIRGQVWEGQRPTDKLFYDADWEEYYLPRAEAYQDIWDFEDLWYDAPAFEWYNQIEGEVPRM